MTYASMENRTLLILDGHSSHRYYPALKYAKDSGIKLMCLPPHCTHRIQPLDVTFLGPLATYYNQEVNRWMKSNPGRVVGPFQIGKIFSAAYGKAATTATASSGFSKTGIFPLNPEVFPDYMFMPSLVTDRPHVTGEDESNSRAEQPSNSPGRSSRANDAPSTSNIDCESTDNGDMHVPISVLSPPPKKLATENTNKRRRTGDFGELTSTPLMEEIKKKHEDKIAKERRKSQRKKVQRKILESESEDELTTQESDDEDAACIYCNKLFSLSRSREAWIKCQICKQWSHAECAGVSSRTKQFICDICK